MLEEETEDAEEGRGQADADLLCVRFIFPPTVIHITGADPLHEGVLEHVRENVDVEASCVSFSGLSSDDEGFEGVLAAAAGAARAGAAAQGVAA